MFKRRIEKPHIYSFTAYGPKRSIPIDCSVWNREDKASVLSCITMGTYMIEDDRICKRDEEHMLAPAWWLPFGYKLLTSLKDDDGSVYAAIFEWDTLNDNMLARPINAPKIIFAFRGTVGLRDIPDDIRIGALTLHTSTRYEDAMGHLKYLLNSHGGANLCITGHSLGAELGLLASVELAAKHREFVDAHLFNPPNVSVSLKQKIDELNGQVAEDDDFQNCNRIPVDSSCPNFGAGLGKWKAHLYSNKKDVWGNRYIRPNGKKGHPSNWEIFAHLYEPTKKAENPIEAHKLHLWWADDLKLRTPNLNTGRLTKLLESLHLRPKCLWDFTPRP